MKPRLLHITDDGDPIIIRDHAVDILAALGWPTDDLTQATADEIATRHAGYANAPESGYWMATLPPAIEARIADAEASGLHYWAAIWTQTWGTTLARIEAITTW